jgi:outer membrane protein assembly factor BamB
VLYALQAGDGALRWARRVGEDLGALPLRVPADELAPELVLVLSSDNRTVTALVADTGAVWWQQTLASREPCLGQPVLIERSLLLPTASGQVEEIEISRGRHLGSYILGQPLSLGAVRQPGTPLVYVPADEYCVYVLDASARRCAAVLYTGHAAGALQTLPLVVPADGSEASAPASASTGWLVLALNQGDHRTELRAYTLPIRQADQAPDPHAPRVEGGVALAPWHGAGQLAVATDGGRLALLGLPQRGSRDPLFFPLLKDDSYAVGSGAAPMRALIAHADVENYWVLSHGKLHRLQRTFRPQTGPDLVQRWPQPPLLGVPLHEASQRTARDGASILYLTTQLPGQPTCLASAVHADSGRIVWQRQLGALPQEPLVAAGDRVLLADAAGLFAFDPATAGAESFKAAGQLLLPRAEPLHEQALLAGARGVWLLRWPARTEVDCPLQIEHVDLAPAAQAKGRRVVLKAAPRGTPALLDDAVLLPLANGIVARVPAADGSPMLGPNWRGDGVDEAQPGHIVAAGSADFFLTDGNRGLKRLHWGTQGDAAVRARAELPHRVVTAPALLWRSQQPWLCVADAAHGLTLLNPRLEVQRRWQLPGTVTAGPFVRDGKIGCVSNQTLFWFDPDAEAPVWEFALAAAPVGAPLLVDGALVVADVQGTLRILDPATGTPRGDGYTFRANVAPVAAPLPLGSGRLFVPLSDGTVMLVPLAALQSGDDPPD